MDAKQVESAEFVRAWEQEITLPTYPLQTADPNPMFLEKRVYQGSSGKVYPNPFTDRVSTEKSDKIYRAVMLENEYVQLMILPEIGGRIQFKILDRRRMRMFRWPSASIQIRRPYALVCAQPNVASAA